MDSNVEKNREAMLKRLASRNQKRVLDAASAKENRTQKIDLEATEKAFLESSPSTINMRTPLNSITSNKINTFSVPSSSSPILSFDEKADKQMVALATWTNTVIGMDSTEELDLGATTAEACRRIQALLNTKKSDPEVDGINEAARRRYKQIFEKNDSDEIKKKCKTLLDDSGIEESIRDLLSRDAVAIRDEHSVYNDLGLQTNLLGTFFCFHPAWLKASLEAIFDTRFDADPKCMIRVLSQFILEQVFSNPKMLKNKKFAQGSGKPIITKPGRQALHRHFLEVLMKMMFLIETANSHRVIPNLTRVFTKTSQFKCLDDMFSALTKKLLTGSSMTFKKAFSKIGFTPNYRQSFFDNYDYQARGFSDFSDGLILAKLIETVGELPYGEVLLKLRDPAGDRIRKLNNVKTVLQKMKTIGIPTEDITPEAIVGGKKESILALLWSIVGVRVAKEKRVKMSRPMSPLESPKKRPRRSAVHDDMSSEVLKACKMYGRELNMEVLDLDTLTDGILLEAIWRLEVPNGTEIQAYSGETLWEKVVSMAELELGIQKGLDQNVALFVKMFIDRTHVVKNYNERFLAVVVEEETKNDETVRIQTVVYSEIHHEVVSPDREKLEVFVDLVDDGNQPMESPGIANESYSSKTFCVKSARPSADSEGVENLLGAPMIPEDVEDSEETLKEEEALSQNAENVQNLSGILIIPDTVVASEEFPEEEAKASESFITEVVFTPGDDATQPMESPKAADSEDVSIRVKVTDSEEGVPTVEDVHIQGAEIMEVPEVASDEGRNREGTSPIPMDTTQPTTAPSTSTTSSVGYEMTEQQRQTEESFRRLIENQKRFVLENKLNLNIDDEETANTPELKKILRKTKELKKKQEEVAKRLGAIERHAMDLKELNEKENAFVEYSTASERSDAGHDDAMLQYESEIVQNVSVFEDKEKEEEKQHEAATKIQKLVRGFLARRRFAMEIRDWREKMIVYNQILAQENEQLEENKDDNGKVESSVQKKLQNCTLYGLTNDNLHVVHIAATIIDRLTDLVPSLLNQFVIDLNGIKPIYKILAVADQGLSYTSILHPLLRVLQKSLQKVPEETSDDVIRPLLQKLSPRLVLLMCKHAQNQDFFVPIITSLISIARRFPDKKVSHIDAQYAIRQTMRKVSDQEAKNHLTTLRHITD